MFSHESNNASEVPQGSEGPVLDFVATVNGEFAPPR